MESISNALEVLRTYDYGSPRAGLIPLDTAATRAIESEGEQARFEEQLLQVFPGARSVAAREYICSLLARIGSARSFPVLSSLLSDRALSSAARTALEAMQSPAAAAVLVRALPGLSGLEKVGAINSLGVLRDPGSVAPLAKLTSDRDPAIAAAAVSAIGEIGSPKAARTLAKAVDASVRPLPPALNDAVLVCADRLEHSGRSAEAGRLRALLPNEPAHVREAVRRAESRARSGASA